MKKDIKVRNEVLNTSETARSKNAYSHSIRMPIGLKAHINIIYPVQLVVGAEYVINWDIPHSKNDIRPDPEIFFYKPMNYKRYGLNMLTGLRINF